MLLRKLKLFGFKSYKDRTIIDFTKIPLNDLFLIQGNTGAGKSSILDAITFALYGGEKKEYISYITNSLREEIENNPSKYKGSIITEVELEFSYDVSFYTIKRFIKIKQFRQFKNISEIYELNLQSYHNGKESKEVPEFLQKLNRDQFTKSIIIPQNQFDQFLKSSPIEKEEILKKIFNTYTFDNFISFLNDKKRNVNSELEMIKIKIEEIVRITNIQKSIEAPNILIEFKRKLLKIQNLIHQNKEKLKEIQQVKCLLETKKNEQKMFFDLLKELKQLKKEQLQLEKRSEEIKKKQEKLENAKKVIELYPLQKELDKLNIDFNTKSNEILQIKATLEKYKVNLKNKEEELKILEDQKQEIEQLQIEISGKKEILPKLKIFQKIQKEIEELEERKKKKQIQLKNHQHKLEELSSQLEEIYRLYFAKRLIPNEPCLICGSRDHPNPFHSTKILDPEEIIKQKQQLEKEIKDLTEEIKSNYEEIQKKEKEIHSIKDYLEKKQYGFHDLVSIEMQLKKEIDISQTKLKNYEKKLKETQQEVQELKTSIGRLEGNQEKIEKFIIQIKEEITQKQMKFNEFLHQEGLQEKNVVDYYLEKKERDFLEQEVNEYKNLYIKIKAKLEEVLKKISSEYSDFSISNLEKESKVDFILEQIKREIWEKEDQIQNLENEIARKNQTIGHLVKDNENFKKAFLSVKAFLKQYKKLSEEFRILHILWHIVSDENPKNLSFHRYILQAYFESVIQYANLRLKKIEPRFLLKATEEKEDLKKKKAGLGIKVYDIYQGERGLEGLSGGETFYISIAMALGLYDIIHTNLSNLKFDFLFIDEGFGSLDKEKLHKVLMIIKEIFLYQSGSSQKQVGIISHVESMKEQIQSQIIVKNQNGISFIEFL